MTSLTALPDSFTATRDTLQRVAVHIVARARRQGGAHSVGLRVTPGGFGTPDFGDDLARVRVSGDLLVRETGGPDDDTAAACAIDGASLDDLAAFAQVDLGAELDVGHDTPPLGDSREPLAVDAASVEALAAWYEVVAEALDRVVARLGPEATPSLVQLWPEHFDVALDAAATAEIRVNLGGSPGDGYHEAPYAYVGPWTDDRPGNESFWNAPFGAVLAHGDVADEVDPVRALADFFLDGTRRLAG